MKYWCFVTSKNNWEICKKNSMWGVDFRYYLTMKNFVKMGDKAVVYTHGGNFVAVVEITTDMKEVFNHIGWKKADKNYMFPYRTNFKIVKEGKVHIEFSTISEDEKAKVTKSNFIDEIVFIADKSKTWNQYLQVSMVNISEEDFNKISSSMV